MTPIQQFAHDWLTARDWTPTRAGYIDNNGNTAIVGKRGSATFVINGFVISIRNARIGFNAELEQRLKEQPPCSIISTYPTLFAHSKTIRRHPIRAK